MTRNIFTCLVMVCLLQDVLAQFNPVTNPLVYHVPAMEEVTVLRGMVYKSVHADTVLRFDMYYPAGLEKTRNLPIVLFANGVGSMQVPDWQIYKDWAALTAANGIIALTHQSRFGKTESDLNDLLDHLRKHSDELQVDKNNIGVWVCSANTPTGWSAANDPKNNFIKAIAIYYGVTRPRERVVKRTDLEILVVRAGLDSHNINAGLEEFMLNALQTDAHVEFINYPEGQHAFDGVDNTERSKEIILQTIDFFKRNLLGDNSEPQSPFITNRQLWQLVLHENKTDEAISQFRIAYDAYSRKSGQFVNFNQLLNENNLNGLGYQLLQSGRTDDAIKIFKVNAEYFPNSANSFDALSDAYEEKGDSENTLLNAKLALEKLDKDTNIPPAFAQAIRQSAESKIDAIENPESDHVPHKRAHHAMVYDPESKSVMMTAGSNAGQSGKTFNDVWRYTNARWTRAGTAGDKRSGIQLAYDSKRRKLYSFGGFTQGNQSSAQLRVFENGGWKVLSEQPEMKAAEPGFVYDESRDKLITFGGSAGRGLVNGATWEWDGATWKKFEGPGPQGRQAFAMVYDSKRKRTIIFGGMGTGPQELFGDTWEYDGKTWKDVSTPASPEPRMAVGYTYDSKRGMLVIFGGASKSGIKNDTWGWNGKEWKKLTDTGPAPRTMGYLAYDRDRDRIVMFGGRSRWPNDNNDTWEWDGTKWEEKK